MPKRFVMAAVLTAALAAGASGAPQKWGGWGDLEHGPKAVGFQLKTAYDQSRSYQSNAAFRGLPEGADTARPIRVYLWYPAIPPKGEGLCLGDYVRMAAEDFSSIGEGQAPVGDNLPLPVPLAKGLTEETRRRLFARPTAACPDAVPLAGRFPLVVIGQGLYYESPLALFTLAEYLASRGYVVATCPLTGTFSRLTNLSAADLETQVRDMEFALAQARVLPFVDKDKIGVVGYDLGGMAGLLLAMRNPWVKALATLDSGILFPHRSGLPGSSPSYQEARFVIPWLMMTQERFVTAWREKAKSLFDRKAIGPSYLLLFDTDNHGAFTSYAMFGIEGGVPGYWGPVKSNPCRVAETACLSAGRFFDGYLKNDLIALEALRQDPRQGGLTDVLRSVEYKPGEPAPLFQDDYLHAIIGRGTAVVLPELRRAIASGECRVHFDEKVLAWLGAHFLYWWGREKEAVEVFELVTELFRESADAFDDLGEACLTVGDKDKALASYRRSLELNPENANAKAMIKRLEEKK